MRSRASWSTDEPAEAAAPATARSGLGLASDALALGVFVLLWPWLAARLVSGASALELLALLFLTLPLGHLMADLVSGLVHWFADEFFEEHTPVIGPLLIYGFRDHHRDPLAIVRHNALGVSGYNALAVLPLLLGLWLWPAGGGFGRAAQACGLAFALSITATNQFHRWAHAERVPPAVRWLQRHRLILSPEGHARHHRRGRGAYCVTAGWLNPPLDAVGLLPALSARARGLGRWLSSGPRS